MSKKLVAYFSAGGTTAKLAAELANLEQADLFEIVPEVLYTAEDLDFNKKESRTSVEMGDMTCRPAIKTAVENMVQYDTVFLGFPIWWGREPSIIDSFIEAYDFGGKKIVPFCTSAMSGIEDASNRMAELTNASVDRGLRLGGDFKEEDVKIWTEKLGL